MLGDQRMQAGDAVHTLRQPRPGQPPALLILDLDIVVILSPVVADEQHPLRSLPIADTDTAPGNPCTLMTKCSRQKAGTTSHQLVSYTHLTLPTKRIV